LKTIESHDPPFVDQTGVYVDDLEVSALAPDELVESVDLITQLLIVAIVRQRCQICEDGHKSLIVHLLNQQPKIMFNLNQRSSPQYVHRSDIHDDLGALGKIKFLQPHSGPIDRLPGYTKSRLQDTLVAPEPALELHAGEI